MVNLGNHVSRVIAMVGDCPKSEERRFGAAADRSSGNIQDKTVGAQIDSVRSDKLAFGFIKDNV